MANQRLFLEEIVTMERVGNSMSTMYSWDGKILTIYWKNKIQKKAAKAGDAFVIACNGGEPEVFPLTAPKGREALVMWLCGFNKPDRAFNEEDYTALIKERRRLYNFWNYQESIVGDMENGWEYRVCNRSDCGGIYHLGAYIKPGISDEGLKAFIAANSGGGFRFPKKFMENKLKSINLDINLDKWF